MNATKKTSESEAYIEFKNKILGSLSNDSKGIIGYNASSCLLSYKLLCDEDITNHFQITTPEHMNSDAFNKKPFVFVDKNDSKSKSILARINTRSWEVYDLAPIAQQVSKDIYNNRWDIAFSDKMVELMSLDSRFEPFMDYSIEQNPASIARFQGLNYILTTHDLDGEDCDLIDYTDPRKWYNSDVYETEEDAEDHLTLCVGDHESTKKFVKSIGRLEDPEKAMRTYVDELYSEAQLSIDAKGNVYRISEKTNSALTRLRELCAKMDEDELEQLVDMAENIIE